jgi:hypothetical protein
MPDLSDITDDGEEDHVWCCNPGRALCGVRLDPADAVTDDSREDEPELCETCRWKEAVGAPCPALFCRLRQRWRKRRSR